MENITTITDCVEFKNELHKKLYVKSGARDLNEYIKYINSIYSDNKTYSGHAKQNASSYRTDTNLYS